MGYSEFPHSDYEHEEMHEFIALYKGLLGKYSGTLDMIENLTNRLDEYEANIDAKWNQLISVTVPAEIEKAIRKEMEDYNRELLRITNSISELRNSVTELSELLDDRFNNLLNELDVLDNKIITEVRILSDRIDGLVVKIDSDITMLSSYVKDEDDKIKAAMIVRDTAVEARSNAYTDSKISELKTLIDKIEIESNILAIKWLWNYATTYGGYNSIEWYNDSTITAEMWHNEKFSALDWHVKGKEIWGWFLRKYSFMYSPVTGHYEDVRKVIYDLCNIVKPNPITAEEYENLQITGEKYENKQVSGFEYDWNGGAISWDT